MKALKTKLLVLLSLGLLVSPGAAQPKKEVRPPLNVKPAAIASDKSVKYDYDIVYVRAPRHGDDKVGRWAEFSDPTRMEAGADLMLLRPDGSEDVLVSGKDGSIMDPFVSFDAQWVFYAKFIDDKHTGTDIYKIHVSSRKVVKLTDQKFTPNLGAAPWAKDFRTPEKDRTALRYGVYNLGPCPVPGGKIVFTSNRNAHVPPRGYPKITLQLFIMDDDGTNVEQIGYLNVACALHPVILTDGRVLFSSLESQGMHNAILWGIWSIHPDGTNWEPVVSAFWTGGAPPGFHFQSQLSDSSIVVEQYYNLNNSGFGTYVKLPLRAPAGVAPFGPGYLGDPRNTRQPYGGHMFHMPFTPYGLQVLTKFAYGEDGPSPSSIQGEQVKAKTHGGTSYPHATGKVTHPSGAPDNHLLTVWSPGPANHQYNYYPFIDAGIYLLKDGKAIDAPGDMLLIKNDPRYNEQWPRALVPYKRIYGIEEPKRLVHENLGKRSPHLPEGTPFGLVGTSSMYKRESAPGGKVPEGSVTAVAADPRRLPLNWSQQGSDAGIYDNSDIHAIRIIAQEPRTDIKGNKGGPLYGNHGMERMRILGEIPVRHFQSRPHAPREENRHAERDDYIDPDGNPDTSFLAKIPADQPFTFQTIDKNGMVLNMAQTWHQLRPGEIRNDCGGCHAHSQKPTLFEKTAAARPDYKVFDLTQGTPLITAKAGDTSGKKWDKHDATGLRYDKGIKNVEYHRDVRPILERSCVVCHTQKAENPAGRLVLDDDSAGTVAAFGADAVPNVQVPITYFRLAGTGQFGKGVEIHKHARAIGHDAATRYVRKFQSRRSLLVWKIYGQRMDGWTNDDFPSETVTGDPRSLRWRGKPVDKLDYNDEGALQRYLRDFGDIDYVGSQMPPPAAVQGSYKGPDGKLIKVAPLSDEDRRTIVRWIDLGCPIDLDPQYDPKSPDPRSFGWMGDDQRPTLTLTHPAPRATAPLTRILVGMHDAFTGLDLKTFEVVADFAIDGVPAGQNLAGKFKTTTAAVWEYRLNQSMDLPERGMLTVSVRDRQGNLSRIERGLGVKRR